MKGQFDKLSQYYKWRLDGDRHWMRVLFVVIALFAVAAFFLVHPLIGYIAAGVDAVLAVVYFAFGAVMTARIRCEEEREKSAQERRESKESED